ncbi:MAG TPA: GldG family protein, partial [bacterium]|nr:GldG family protein [bacterium]
MKQIKIKVGLTRDQEKTLTSSVAALLLVAILVVVNLLGDHFFWRFDLTRDRVYTLSRASRELVRNLPDKVIAKAYYTDGLPSPYSENRKYLEDKLTEYAAYSNGNFSYEFIDPGDDEEAQQEAQSYGIYPVQIDVWKSDEYQAKAAYMGVVLIYSDADPETVTLEQDTTGLEYAISSALQKITAEEKLTVAFLQDADLTVQLQSKAQYLSNSLSKLYDVTSVEPENLVTDDYDILIVG